MLPSEGTPLRRLRTTQAAAYTGIAKSTLEKLRVYGGGCRYIQIGRVVLYDPADLDVWLDEHKRHSTAGGAR
jgi:hypothetical protein